MTKILRIRKLVKYPMYVPSDLKCTQKSHCYCYCTAKEANPLHSTHSEVTTRKHCSSTPTLSFHLQNCPALRMRKGRHLMRQLLPETAQLRTGPVGIQALRMGEVTAHVIHAPPNKNSNRERQRAVPGIKSTARTSREPAAR